jgi:hypothetical protein
MGAAVAIGRLDMTASALRAAASREKDGAAARRISKAKCEPDFLRNRIQFASVRRALNS